MTSSSLRLIPSFPLVSALVVISALSSPVNAQTPEAAGPPSTLLPVRAVTLFSSGVSYTMREGEVSGDATVPLLFRTAQIDDILKSLVLLDEKGTVEPAIYAAKDPVGRALQSFAVDVSQPTDRVALLNRLKGAKVAVDAGGTVIAASTVTEKVHVEGLIVGVDKEENGGYGGGGEVLSLLGETGLTTVRLSEVRTIRFLDERVNQEFKAALGLLASGADDKRRQVTLRFDGVGTRKVYVGYVSEAPLWKISYRLLIGGTGAATGKGGTAPSFLQGWALVENTTDEDWTGIRLSLVSGRPISFIQDLYQPLYLPRPVVPPDVVASPFPQLTEAAIDENSKDKAAANGPITIAGGAFGGRAADSPARRSSLKPEGVANIISNDSDNSLLVEYDDIKKSVVAQASGQKAGELFAYNIATPVTLPRQQAAMIPVVAQDIDGEKVSLFNPETDPRFPLNAFRIRNNTGLHLKGGPITLFDSGIYAGDARMEDIPPGDSRLVTYAVDLTILGERQETRFSDAETGFVLRHGTLIINHRQRESTTYNLKNKGDRERTVIVEHPFSVIQKLIQPEKSTSRTATHFRFDVAVPAGESKNLTVVIEQPTQQTVALLDGNSEVFGVYLKADTVPATVKAALREVLTRRRAVQALQAQVATTDEAIKSVDTDQDRIRKNMEALDRQSDLYKRYVAQLDAQETRIETLRAEANRLRTATADADKDLRAYIDGINLSAP